MTQAHRLQELYTLSAARTFDPDFGRLVEGLIGGEQEAARRAWRLFSKEVHRQLRQMLGPTAELDDLAQEVFLRLFAGVKRLREAAALPAFVTTITLHVAKSELTRRYRRRWLSFFGSAEHAEVTSTDYDARAALRRLYALLDTLEPVARMIFVLRHVEEMELEMIARTMKLSLSTLKRKLVRVDERVAAAIANDALLAPYGASMQGVSTRSQGGSDG